MCMRRLTSAVPITKQPAPLTVPGSARARRSRHDPTAGRADNTAPRAFRLVGRNWTSYGKGIAVKLPPQAAPVARANRHEVVRLRFQPGGVVPAEAKCN